MSRRFGRERRREVPRLNTSSLPDLIFTLLFFFMLVTNLRESRPKVDYRVPEAARAERLEKKSLVTTIYVGRAAAGDGRAGAAGAGGPRAHGGEPEGGRRCPHGVGGRRQGGVA